MPGIMYMLDILMWTYNHAQYIAQAIEGVLMQKTPFKYRLLIGDDASLDHTRKIIKDYAQKHSDIIFPILHEKNIGAHKNFESLFKRSKAKYIALNDGDDYWTDPSKLQKQVDFLDNNPDCTICFHWADWLEQESGEIRYKAYGPPIIKPFYTFDDLLEHSNFLPTSSVVFKNRVFEEFPGWFYETAIGDLPLHLLNAQHGKIGFLDESMAVYRLNRGGIYGGETPVRQQQKLIDTYWIIGSNLQLESNFLFHLGLSKWYGDLSKAYRHERRLYQWLVAIINSFRAGCRTLKLSPPNKKKYVIAQIISTLSSMLLPFRVFRFLHLHVNRMKQKRLSSQ